MRNHITPSHCALSNTSIEALQVSTASNSNHRLEMVNRDHADDGGTSSEVPSQIVPASLDFEGFGSFS